MIYKYYGTTTYYDIQILRYNHIRLNILQPHIGLNVLQPRILGCSPVKYFTTTQTVKYFTILKRLSILISKCQSHIYRKEGPWLHHL